MNSTIPGEPGTPAEARALLAAIEAAIPVCPPTDVPPLLRRLRAAYDAFPELWLEQPPDALLNRLRAAADALPDEGALPLLLFGTAAFPASPIALAFFERLAGAGGLAEILHALRLLRAYRRFGWDEMAPVIELLRRFDGERRAFAALAEVLSGPEFAPPQKAADLGQRLAPVLGDGDRDAAGAARLATAAMAARARLDRAVTVPAAAGDLRPSLPTARRLSRLVSGPGAQPDRRAPLAWPSGDFSLVEFLAQWPELSLEIPALLMHSDYAACDADGVLRADTHPGSPFCYGPYLNLPAGRYDLRISGETAAETGFTVSVTRFLGANRNLVHRRVFSCSEPVRGTIAQIGFESFDEMPLFEVVIELRQPQGRFALSSIRIEARQPWAEPPAAGAGARA